MRGRDPAAQLLRALARDGGAINLTHAGETPWSSATFVGAQHRVTAIGASDAWLASLSDAEFTLHGCFVAGIDVIRMSDGAMLTVLVLEE